MRELRFQFLKSLCRSGNKTRWEGARCAVLSATVLEKHGTSHQGKEAQEFLSVEFRMHNNGNLAKDDTWFFRLPWKEVFTNLPLFVYSDPYPNLEAKPPACFRDGLRGAQKLTCWASASKNINSFKS